MHVPQRSVDAVADPQAVSLGLNVDVGSAVPQPLGEQQIDDLHDWRGWTEHRQGLHGRLAHVAQHRTLHRLAHLLVHRVGAVLRALDGIRVGELEAHAAAHGLGEEPCECRVSRLECCDMEPTVRAELVRKDLVLTSECRSHAVHGLGLSLDGVEIEWLEPQLVGERPGNRVAVHPETDEDLAERAVVTLLLFEREPHLVPRRGPGVDEEIADAPRSGRPVAGRPAAVTRKLHDHRFAWI